MSTWFQDKTARRLASKVYPDGGQAKMQSSSGSFERPLPALSSQAVEEVGGEEPRSEAQEIATSVDPDNNSKLISKQYSVNKYSNETTSQLRAIPG